jgi:cardiolipin synthase
MNLPNLITVFRIVLVPLITWLIINNHWAAAFALFILAGVSDGVDGFIAKRFDMETELGAYLDPLADKALLVSIYIALGFLEQVPSWLVIVVVSRDILIVGAVLLSWMMERPVEMSPSMISKVNTTGQILFAVVVLGDLGFALDLPDIRLAAAWIVGGLTVASGATYLWFWLHEMANSDS